MPEEVIAWRPQPGPQSVLLSCPIQDIFYGGARGGGKTDACLGEWMVHAWAFGQHAHGVFFRRHLHELDAVVRRSKELFSPFATYLKQQKTWEWNNGATLMMRHLDTIDDTDLYKGQSFTRIYFEELADWPYPEPKLRLSATLRSAQGVPTKSISTGNPGGPGQAWVKEMYVEPARFGYKLIEAPFRGIDGWERTFIPAKLRDNQILVQNDPTYQQKLRSVGHEALVRAWEEGDWDAVEGAFFSDWNRDKHIIPATFTPPPTWTCFRALDWGSEAPFWVGWFTVSDGTMKGLPSGALIIYREWYERGARLSAEKFADGIRELTDKPQAYTEADPSIFREDGGPSIAERMGNSGVICVPGDNSRIAGWDQMRGRLKGIDDRPMLYVTENCKHFISSVSSVQCDRLKIEDVDTTGDDHPVDGARYGCMSRPWIAPHYEPKPKGLTGDQVIRGLGKRRSANV